MSALQQRRMSDPHQSNGAGRRELVHDRKHEQTVPGSDKGAHNFSMLELKSEMERG